MTPTLLKTEAVTIPPAKPGGFIFGLKIIDQLPDTATWQNLMHRIYVRLAIESGLSDSKAGETVSVSEIRAKYGLTK